MVDVTLE